MLLLWLYFNYGVQNNVFVDEFISNQSCLCLFLRGALKSVEYALSETQARLVWCRNRRNFIPVSRAGLRPHGPDVNIYRRGLFLFLWAESSRARKLSVRSADSHCLSRKCCQELMPHERMSRLSEEMNNGKLPVTSHYGDMPPFNAGAVVSRLVLGWGRNCRIGG